MVLTNTYAMTEDGWRRTPKGSDVLVHGGDAFPATSGGNRGVAGLLLGAAIPVVATSHSGGDRGDDEVRLEQGPAVAKLGFTSARYFRRSSASRKGRPGLLSSLRCRRKWQRWTKATREDGNSG
uniref:OSJNBa0070D17.13 protein n=1 Tax=Oryza sativa subsp. japonica TaxID=39947 RepID=Q7XLT5_ORYSJ|nr:OSJNBa0070D17.13 [Oryza sativa Japonica Group]